MAMISRTLRERLEHGVSLLALIHHRRAETGAPSLGANIERMIIERELGELEATMIHPDQSVSTTLPARRIIR